MVIKTFQKRVEETRAREELSALIEAINTGGGAVEITDNDRVAAVLLSGKDYEWLCACSKKVGAPKRDARGIISLCDDSAMNTASEELSADFDASILKTASEL